MAFCFSSATHKKLGNTDGAVSADQIAIKL
jgi:hypothetical protein